jgi:hypothetical protein
VAPNAVTTFGAFVSGVPQPNSNATAPLAMIGKAMAQGCTMGVAASNAGVAAQPEFWPDMANNTNTQNAWPYAWKFEHGFLGCGKILDTATLGRVDIIIRWANRNVVMRGPGDSTSDPSFQIQNLRAFVSVCDLDPLYYNALQARMATAPLVVNFKRYVTTSATVTGTSSSRWSVTSQSIDAIHAFLVHQNPTRLAQQIAAQATPLPYTENSLDQVEPVFRRYSCDTINPQPTGWISGIYSTVNSVSFPQVPLNIAESYWLLYNSNREFWEKSQSSVPELNFVSWYMNKFAFSYRWAYDKGLIYRSGIDSRNLSLNGTLEINATGPLPARLLMYIETTASLLIGANRAVSVVY